MMRVPSLLKVAASGRGTFLVAGGVLGVGLYGFVATFKPYESDRVMQPLAVIDAPLSTSLSMSLQIFPDGLSTDAIAESAPEPVEAAAPATRVMAAPDPAPAAAPPSAEAAGGDGGVTPLPPAPTPNLSGIGPVIVEAEAGTVPTASSPEATLPSAPEDPQAGGPQAGGPDDRDDDAGETPSEPSPNTGEGENGNRNGKSVGKGQAKAKGHAR